MVYGRPIDCLDNQWDFSENSMPAVLANNPISIGGKREFSFCRPDCDVARWKHQSQQRLIWT